MIASNRPDYSEGDIVLAQTGSRTHAVSDVASLRKLIPPETTAHDSAASRVTTGANHDTATPEYFAAVKNIALSRRTPEC
jgi:NADPH-dependent curcumin reductase CurA